MKIPFTRGVYILVNLLLFIMVPLVVFGAVCMVLDDSAKYLTVAILLLVYMAIVLCITGQFVTRTHLYSLIPPRRMQLSKADLTLYLAEGQQKPAKGIVQLRAGSRVSWILLYYYPQGMRERFLNQLKAACATYSEQRAKHLFLGIPLVRTDMTDLARTLVVILSLHALPLIASHTPTPPVVRQMQAQGLLRSAESVQDLSRKWSSSYDCQIVADEMLKAVLGEKQADWLARPTPENRADTLLLATDWYRRAETLNHDTYASLYALQTLRNLRFYFRELVGDFYISGQDFFLLRRACWYGCIADRQSAEQLLALLDHLKQQHKKK